jgi:hypothetical protein
MPLLERTLTLYWKLPEQLLVPTFLHIPHLTWRPLDLFIVSSELDFNYFLIIKHNLNICAVATDIFKHRKTVRSQKAKHMEGSCLMNVTRGSCSHHVCTFQRTKSVNMFIT